MTDYIRHRTFITAADLKKITRYEPTHVGDMRIAPRTTEDWRNRVEKVHAAILIDKAQAKFEKTTIGSWKGQKLSAYATAWEKRWAIPIGEKRGVPVVMPFNEGNLLIGHIKRVPGDKLWVYKEFDGEWNEIIDNNIPIMCLPEMNFGHKENRKIANSMETQFKKVWRNWTSEDSFKIFFDINGDVIDILDYEVKSNLVDTLQVDDIFALATGAWIVKRLIRNLVTKKNANGIIGWFRKAGKTAKSKPKKGKVRSKIKASGKTELTREEMEALLEEIWEENPILERLRKAHGLSGKPLRDELDKILEVFERETGIHVEWVQKGMVQSKRGVNDFGSLRSRPGFFQLEKQLRTDDQLKQFLDEVRHGLAHHYASAGNLDRLVRQGPNNAMEWLEMMIESGPKEVLKFLRD